MCVVPAVAGLSALALAVRIPPRWPQVFSLGGVVAAGTALRAERRRAGYAAAALFLSTA
ncbi:hypothetical protein ACGH7X_39280 [Streptomyces sp. BBFR51]|uniref:hypothetical protein n=1 Tax=Streptomyces sp. BBFR51 TaxID=3372856 RepID=UPI0037DD5DE6